MVGNSRQLLQEYSAACPCVTHMSPYVSGQVALCGLLACLQLHRCSCAGATDKSGRSSVICLRGVSRERHQHWGFADESLWPGRNAGIASGCKMGSTPPSCTWQTKEDVSVCHTATSPDGRIVPRGQIFAFRIQMVVSSVRRQSLFEKMDASANTCPPIPSPGEP